MPETTPSHPQLLQRAGQTIQHYKTISNKTEEPDDTVVIDLLTDLMHWCDQHQVNFEQALAQANGHYIFEHEEDPRLKPVAPI